MRRRSERVRERGAVAPELPRNGRVYSGQEGVVCASFFGARSGVAHLPLMSGGTGASVIPHGAGHTDRRLKLSSETGPAERRRLPGSSGSGHW